MDKNLLQQSLGYAIVVLVALSCQREPTIPANILLIVVDDMGYSDAGFMGSEIRTPNLDLLASESFLFTNFYTAPSCSPTRAMLLTGVDHHLSGLGTMVDEWDELQKGQPGYEGHLNDRVKTIPAILQSRGYFTAMVGKWHLGMAPELGPHQRGFGQSMVLLQGGASHFGDSIGLVRQAIPQYRLNGDPHQLERHFYSSKGFTDYLLGFLKQPSDAPFFAYAAYTAPHWPLQVPDSILNSYLGQYDGGYDQMRVERFENLNAWINPKIGLPPKRLDFIPAWEELSPEAQKLSARKMEIYAGMITYLDEQIGRLIATLKEDDVYDNTWIIFMSDNGPEGNAIQYLADNELWVPAAFDQSYGAIGRKGSYTFQGPGWAQVSAMPFNYFKVFQYEGGIRSPLLIKPPKGDRPLNPFQSEALVTVKDLGATLLDFAGVDQNTLESTLAGYEPITGRSILPLFKKPSASIRNEVAGELFGRRSIRVEKWKAVWQGPPYGNGEWALFDLSVDPGEQTNLAHEEPKQLNKLVERWEIYRESNHLILPSHDTGYANERF